MNFLESIASLFKYTPGEPLLFSSGQFLLLFIIFLTIYIAFIKRKMFISIYVVLFSLFFYYRSSGVYVWILILTTITDYWFGNKLWNSKSETWRKIWLVMGVLPSMLLLAYFKYTNFIIFNISQIIGNNFSPLDIFLPVGISFYTFQSVSYIIDIYRKKIEPASTMLDYAFFLTFFPQLVAGPIVKANLFLPQLKQERQVSKTQVYTGLWLIIIGLVKKGVIADYIAQYNDLVFAAPQNYTGFENLMAVYGYALQIFCDFSGYSDMAIGMGKIMGFDLGINFNSPYKSIGISDFWRRWHISLSTWLREYIYYPLGGNRTISLFSVLCVPIGLVLITLFYNQSWINVVLALLVSCVGLAAYKYSERNVLTYIALSLLTVLSIYWFTNNIPAAVYSVVVIAFWLLLLARPQSAKSVKQDINLVVLMLIGGLWHGAAWKFIFWGGTHGVALAIDKFLLKILPKNKTVKALMWFFTFNFVVLLWMFFRANDIQTEIVLEDQTTVTQTISAFEVPIIMLEKIIDDFDISFAIHFWDARYVWVIMVLFGFICHAVPEKAAGKVRDFFIKCPFAVKVLILLVVMQLVIQFKNETVQPFIYFQF